MKAVFRIFHLAIVSIHDEVADMIEAADLVPHAHTERLVLVGAEVEKDISIVRRDDGVPFGLALGARDGIVRWIVREIHIDGAKRGWEW